MQLFGIHLDFAGLSVRFAVTYGDDAATEPAPRRRTSVADLPRLELSRD